MQSCKYLWDGLMKRSFNIKGKGIDTENEHLKKVLPKVQREKAHKSKEREDELMIILAHFLACSRLIAISRLRQITLANNSSWKKNISASEMCYFLQSLLCRHTVSFLRMHKSILRS